MSKEDITSFFPDIFHSRQLHYMLAFDSLYSMAQTEEKLIIEKVQWKSINLNWVLYIITFPSN